MALESTSGSMYLYMTSDRSKTYQGFLAAYSIGNTSEHSSKVVDISLGYIYLHILMCILYF